VRARNDLLLWALVKIDLMQAKDKAVVAKGIQKTVLGEKGRKTT
jgi:hypothetical protein